jgi:hypothetical protein
MLRIRALWYHLRQVVTAVTLLCIGNILTFIITIAYGLATATIGPATYPFTGCFFNPSFRRQYISFITSIVFETVIITLTIIRVWSVMYDGQRRLPLFTLLIQDGLLYYISIMCIHFIVLFTGLFADFTVALAIFGSLPSIAVAGVACNRMLLRLQGILLASDIISSDIGMTDVDVSARIRTGTAAITTDVEIGGSIPS